VDIGADAAAYFARMSRDLLEEPDESTTLPLIAERSVDAVPACDWSGILLRRRRGRVELTAASSPLAETFDGWQDELGEGPGLAAIKTNDCQLVDDVRNDARWPTWATRVAGAGVGSGYSVPLSTETHALGALNLYAAKPFAFDAVNVERAEIFAAHAATALVAARLVSGLRTAVQSRHVIGVAQGIIMQRYDMTLDASFEVLLRYSSHSNRKLRDVAQLVADMRVLPADYTDLDSAISEAADGGPEEGDEEE
jgi:GAF domain-containing protein